VKLPAPVSELGELWLGAASVTPLLRSGVRENCSEGAGGGFFYRFRSPGAGVETS
jgi:hypothetical protein